MDALELIRTTHGIDRDLGIVGDAVRDAGLKERLLAVRIEWRDLAYAITAELCGVDGPEARLPSPRRRGRPRKSDLAASAAALASDLTGRGADDAGGGG